MDLKNTLAAVSLSAAIIVLWGLFFAPDPQQVKDSQLEKNQEKSVCLQLYVQVALFVRKYLDVYSKENYSKIKKIRSNMPKFYIKERYH